MRAIAFFVVVLAGVLILVAAAATATELSDAVNQDEARLISIFKELHRNPELQFMEIATAARVAKELRSNGFEVHDGIAETGVVGILRSGEGPVVMYRADMDGLPVEEETDLPYKSVAVKPDRFGVEHPTMHACGHDAHVTWLIGMAKVLAAREGSWSGTAILLAQPAEETIEGATAMVEAGLYDIVPKPDIIISGHNLNVYPAGSVAIASGRRMAGTDQLDVVIHGVGGHGSTPNAAKDPIVMGAMATMGYQAVISRVIDQYQPAVLTVGAFQAGESNNVIPDSALLKLNLRWYTETERKQMIRGIHSVTDNIAHMYGMPEDRMPTYEMKGYATPVINSEAEVERARGALVEELGADRVLPGIPPAMGSEDFQMLAAPFADVPTLFLEIGAGKPNAYTNLIEKGEPPPFFNHNPRYEVDLQAIPTGTIALTRLVLEYLGD